MLSHVGHIGHPCASTSNNMVPGEVWASLLPEIVEPKQRRAALKGDRFRIKGSPYEREVRPLTAMIAFRQEEDGQGDTARTIYISSRPTWDLLQQPDGEAPIEYTKPEMDLPQARRPGQAPLRVMT